MKFLKLIQLGLCVPALQAAPITWGAAGNVSAASDVSTNGALVEAFNLGGTGVANAVADETVNGVLFTAKTDLLSNNSSLDVFSGSSGDAGYDNLLGTVDFGGGTNLVSLSLGNGSLVSGANYEIQVWFNDTRYTNRDTPVGDGLGNKVTLNSTGQFATGVFTADASSQTLTLESPTFGNAHLNAYQIRSLSDDPLAIFSGATTADGVAYSVALDFSEPVTGLTESDLSVTNGSLVTGSLSGSGQSYTFDLTATGAIDFTVSLPASAVVDVDGNPNAVASRTFPLVDLSDGPVPTLIQTRGFAWEPYEVKVHFDRAISGLALSDFTVTNATLSNFIDHTLIHSDNIANYTVTVTPTTEGMVTIMLPSASVTGDSDGLGNVVSNTLTSEYKLAPRVEINGASTSATREFEVFFSFTPDITGFTASDIVVTNGSVTSLTMQGRREFSDRFYRVAIEAEMPGNVTVSLPAGQVANQANPSHLNSASNLFTVAVSDDFSENWIVDTDTEWSVNEGSSSNLTLSNGYAEPTANSSTYTSVMKSYPVPKRATKVTLTQSSAWDNWTAVGNVQPTGAGNAPIFLPLGNDDYYFFGQSTNSAYHAWHSTDMVNWTKLDQFADNNDKWATSAEYKDGTFYLLVDTPNDHTPTMYTDTDLNDGQPGTNHGVVAQYETNGGDSALFRDNADGLFHIFTEDHTPIQAAAHKWDSPLALHVTSEDGITGFVPGEHLPPIDFRATPTGTTGTYDHPHVSGSPVNNPQIYEVHSGEQVAMGDWTMLKVGQRYYLFGDYEHDDGSGFINSAILTSDSIYEGFELINDLGSGHPDPTCGFAEGQFYLITQQSTDYVSPGPWVDGVEARVGVDTNNDGSVNQWTSWQAVSESYDHTPGYARVVTTTPAEIDLSSLPPGYGFQFEFRLDDTVVSGASPVMDRVEIAFEPSHFQQWANAEGTPAEDSADHNGNGVPNLLEFAVGELPYPELSPANRLTYTLSPGAVADGVIFLLEYSEDLNDWDSATSATPGVSLLGTTPDPSGEEDYLFEVDADNYSKLFWRSKVSLP